MKKAPFPSVGFLGMSFVVSILFVSILWLPLRSYSKPNKSIPAASMTLAL